MRNKQVITEELLELIPKNNRPDLEHAMLTWWFNLRENGGLRLTDTGYKTLKNILELESYRFDLNQPRSMKNKKLILALDRKLQWPYYMEKSWIDFFSSKEAMLAKLYPDLEKFLSLYQ